MRGFLRQGMFLISIQTIICLCVFAIFLAIYIDFVLFSRKVKVQKEKKSIVETGTMTLFFFLFYGTLRIEAGVVPLQYDYVKKLLMIVGTAMVIAGCFVNIKGRFNLGRNWANQIKIYQEQTLVMAGMYRFVRHPLYASIITMFYGGCLIYRNIFSFVAVSIVFVPFMAYRAKQEESMLIQRFPKYCEYKQRTGMFFPKIIRAK